MLKGSKKENGRIHKLSFRFTEDEVNELKQKAKKNNMSLSEYIRYLIKKDK